MCLRLAISPCLQAFPAPAPYIKLRSGHFRSLLSLKMSNVIHKSVFTHRSDTSNSNFLCILDKVVYFYYSRFSIKITILICSLV